MAAGISVNDYYDGFRTFTFIADFFHVPVDQVNFLITQVTALILAGLLRTTLSPVKTTPAIRHAFSLVVGIALGYFCFGRQAMHLAGLPVICYVAMCTQSPQNIHRVVLSLALFYLSCIHVHRQYYDYGSYTLDITGPLMVITQKVTSLAYSIHDGLGRREEDLTPSQRHYAVRKIPSVLEYLSYVFYFQALMAGPIIFYRDYIDYVYGYRLRGNIETQPLKNTNANQVNEIVLEPPPTMAMIQKVVSALLCAVIFVIFLPMYPIQRIKEDDFLENTSILYKFWYLNLATMFARFKYYHAWLFADAISINAGLGLWYDESNVARWDLFSNVDVIGFETALTFKDCIEHWNKGTNRWLRTLVYERVKGRRRLIYTYALSAIWHGFYPGYYLTFAGGALFTVAARTVRRSVRPYFLDTPRKKYFYDMLTMLTTRFVMAYCTFSFVLLEFMPSIKLYQSVYFLPHLLSLAVIIILPRLPKLGKSSHKETNSSTNNTKRETNGDAHKTS